MLAVPPPSLRRVAKVSAVVMLAGATEAVYERLEYRSLGGRGTVVAAFLLLAVGTAYAFLWALWKARKESKWKNRQGS